MNASPSPMIDDELNAARALIQNGRADQAEPHYARILDMDSENVEALTFLGTAALHSNRTADAIALLDRAVRANPAISPTQCNLGLAYLAADLFADALAPFAVAVKLKPDFFAARLYYARTLDMLGRQQEALTHYFSAITRAQKKGRWLNDATTAESLRELVRYAIDFVYPRRKRVFEQALDRARERYGSEALRRVEKCLRIYLGELPPNYPDSRQKPNFLYFPDLPTTAYFDRALFPWYSALEENFETVRSELMNVLGSDRGLEPFLGEHSDEQIAGYLGGDGKPTWDAFFFYRHGKRYDDNCARCPKTAAIIDSLPTLVRVRDHAPEVCFSILTPGTHILPHRGVTNTRLVTHFPLIVPNDCALNVGDEQHVWQEGQCISFDDTFEHEAWNRSDRIRAVMLIDVWNPHLTPAERDGVTELVEAIGDFNTAAEEA